MDANLLKGHLDLILLAALERGSKYGGQIMAEVSARTEGALVFKEGSLYPALHRLERAGWIVGEFRSLATSRAPVRFYTLTGDGRRALHEKRDAYHAFSGHVRRLLGGEP